MNTRSTLAHSGTRVAFFGLVVLAIALAGCSSSVATSPATQAPPAPAVAPAPTQAPAAPAQAPAAAAPAAATKPASIMLAKNDALGTFLADDQGRTLYLFTKDTPNTSNCYDKCEAAWPPLFTKGAPVADDGVDAALLGTTTRKDGSIQVTYNGWPLYYYVKDQKPGEVTGQNVGDVWFVLSAQGEMIDTRPAASESGSANTPAPAAEATGAIVALTKNDQLGTFLADDKGMTLYLFTKDTPNTSNCYDQCEKAWPVLFTKGAPQAGKGVDAALLGTTTRKDGSIQVTYNGWPLYYFAKDQKPGDVTGQNVGDVWFVISAKGEMIDTRAAASSSGAASTPASGGSSGQAAGQTVKINVQNFAFDPKSLNIKAGTTVVWHNSDSVMHTVTSDTGLFDSPLPGGADFQFTFNQPGTFQYYCKPHGGPGEQGMSGVITVS
jgi:predicted lipoprotein with Yx(FWY)xxD motif/plastocyanin